jgi:hypothetical protein
LRKFTLTPTLSPSERETPSHGFVFRGGFEVTVFVKDVVGGKQCLGAGGYDLAVLQERDGVRGFAPGPNFVATDITDDERSAASGVGKTLESFEVSSNEAILEQEIARWIAGDCQLGDGDEVSAGTGGAIVRGEDLGLVAGDVSDGRVNLGQCQFHSRTH